MTLFNLTKNIFVSVAASVPITFVFHMLFSIVLNVIVIPMVDTWLFSSVISGGDNYLFVIAQLLELTSRVHKLYLINHHTTQLSITTSGLIEKATCKRIRMVSHACQKTLINNKYSTLKDALKWNLNSFIIQIIDSLSICITVISCSFWLIYNSPATILVYIFGIISFFYFSKLDSVPWSEYSDIWDMYHSYADDQYSNFIHSRGDKCHDKMIEWQTEYAAVRGKDRSMDNKYSEHLNILLSVSTIIGFCINYQMTSVRLIMYVQTVRTFTGNLQSFVSLVTQWNSTDKEYTNFEKQFENTIKVNDVDQLPISEIIIHKGSSYERDEFAISIANEITLIRGHVILVDGPSGSGKSTLFDVITGVIAHANTNFVVSSDGKRLTSGFEHFKETRKYVASDITIRTDKSAKDILTSFGILLSNDSLMKDTLKISCCDFITDLSVKITGLSKGQTNRLKVAKYVYEILVDNPGMVILDEIVDGVDKSTIIQITTSLFKYFRENGIVCLVATHFDFVKALRYDQVISVNRGIICVN